MGTARKRSDPLWASPELCAANDLVLGLVAALRTALGPRGKVGQLPKEMIDRYAGAIQSRLLQADTAFGRLLERARVTEPKV